MPKLTVVPQGISVDLGDDETILEGLYRHGYAYRIGCRRGGCAVCKVDLIEGSVGYNRSVADAVLSADEIEAGTCLTCRAVPKTDITIALREDNLRRVASLLARYAATNTG